MPITTIKKYMGIVKLGIIRGNAIVAFAGFMFASKGNVSWSLLGYVLLGTSLIIGSACVFNNIIDRGRDAYMERTKKRALVTGEVSVGSAAIFGAILGLLGAYILYNYVNSLTLLVGVIGFVDYVFVYTLLKPKTRHATLLGGISGATPPVAGYVAVVNHFDATALWLFIVLLCWQMPHFFAIGIFRKKDYAAAKIPILTVSRGIETAKKQILLYAAGFGLACIGLSIAAKTSYVFVIVMSLLTLYWLYYGFNGFRASNEVTWSKGMFGISLLILLVFSTVLAVDFWLPWRI